MIFTGRLSVVSSSGVALSMKPPQQGTAASTATDEQANSSVWRPPEQKPMQPTLPLAPSNPRRYAAAASRSATAWASGTPNILDITEPMLVGSGAPLRQ